MAELLIGKAGGITTYAREDNTSDFIRLGPVRSVADENRLNGLIGSSRVDLSLGKWIGVALHRRHRLVMAH